VLNLLHGQSNGLSQTELGHQLLMHRSNITGLLDRLEKRGLVKRHDVASDRRAYRVGLTPAGARLMHEILPEYFQGAEQLWENVPAKRVSQLVADLRSVAESAERIADVRRKRGPSLR
jgi:DNA-binding MarR family transcriptional regulator